VDIVFALRCPRPHDKFGKSFEEAYLRYEDKAARGELKLFKKVSATQLWRKMLSMLFETGHPWDHVQGPVQPAQPATARGRWCHSPTLARDHPQHLGRRDRGVQPRLDQPAPHMTDQGWTSNKLKRTIRHRDARCSTTSSHIKLLRSAEGAQFQQRHRPVAWDQWASRIACT